MVHARKDYNRFQEPDELLQYISFLINRLEAKEVLCPYDYERLRNLRAKYSRIVNYNPIADDEPVFLLRALDRHFVPMLLQYFKLIAQDKDISTEQIIQFTKLITAHIALAEKWQEENLCKSPTVPLENEK